MHKLYVAIICDYTPNGHPSVVSDFANPGISPLLGHRPKTQTILTRIAWQTGPVEAKILSCQRLRPHQSDRLSIDAMNEIDRRLSEDPYVTGEYVHYRIAKVSGLSPHFVSYAFHFFMGSGRDKTARKISNTLISREPKFGFSPDLRTDFPICLDEEEQHNVSFYDTVKSRTIDSRNGVIKVKFTVEEAEKLPSMDVNWYIKDEDVMYQIISKYCSAVDQSAKYNMGERVSALSEVIFDMGRCPTFEEVLFLGEFMDSFGKLVVKNEGLANFDGKGWLRKMLVRYDQPQKRDPFLWNIPCETNF